MEYAPTLTVLMGIPGAGKSTWAADNAHSDVVLCGMDKLRIDPGLQGRAIAAFVQSLRKRAERALGEGRDVLVDGCHTRRDQRTRWRELAYRYRVDAHLVVLHVDLDTALAAQRERARPVSEARLRGYDREFAEALDSIDDEDWSRIHHVHRDGDPMAGRGHTGHHYREIWRVLIEAPEFLVCEIPGCYKPIDRSIRGRTSWAPSLDMIVPWSRGGDPADPGNYRPAHYGCNSRRGNGRARKPERAWTTEEAP